MEKILIVDDIEVNRKLLSKMLGVRRGYKIIEASNGVDAFKQFEKEKPDLILMDINMPVMDGYQSAAKIKAKTGDNYTPIIFVTALSADASLTNAIASGGDDFISKPFNVEVLESKVNAHLRIRELNQQLSDKNKQLVRHNQHLRAEQQLVEHFFESALKQSYLDKKVIKYHMSPMSVFNGDVLMVERGPKGGIYAVVGDFTGHGLTAAMGTLPVALIFFKMVAEGSAIGEIARELNHQLNKLIPTNIFFAATLLEINASGDTMSVWAGGMPDIYWLGDNGALKSVINSQHMPLGILEDSKFNEATRTFSVENGDKVYLYSDGVIEAHRESGEMFGEERFKEILVTHRNGRFEQVLTELKAFTGTLEQRDDLTLVEITCCKVPEPEQDEDNSDVKSFVVS